MDDSEIHKIDAADATRGLVIWNGKDEEETHEEWLVEKVLKKWVNPREGSIWYLIKWEGWSKSYNSWEPLHHLTNCPHLLRDFDLKERHKVIQKRLRIKAPRSTRQKRNESPTVAEVKPEPVPSSSPILNCVGVKLQRVSKEHEPISEPSVAKPVKEMASGQEKNEELGNSKRSNNESSETCSPSSMVENEGSEDSSDDERDVARLHKIYTPNFYLRWPKAKIPIAITGSSLFHGTLLHSVRLKPDTVEETQQVLKDPAEGTTFSNSIIVTHKGFKRRYPEMLDEYVKQKITITD